MELWVIVLVAFSSVLAVVATFMAGYACHRAINAEVDVKALQNSTHQIQMVPVEPPSVAEMAEERQLNKEFDRAERDAMRRVHEIHEESDPLM